MTDEALEASALGSLIAACPARKRREKRQMRHMEDTELNEARTKLDIVDRPVRTACTNVHHYNSTQYPITETVLSIFPFPQTNTRCSQM